MRIEYSNGPELDFSIVLPSKVPLFGFSRFRIRHIVSYVGVLIIIVLLELYVKQIMHAAQCSR